MSIFFEKLVALNFFPGDFFMNSESLSRFVTSVG